jgi:xanthine dehydrogenase accessory factor
MCLSPPNGFQALVTADYALTAKRVISQTARSEREFKVPADSDNKTIIVRGGGDLATGVVQKFVRAGFNVLILEAESPTAIRRSVALCEAAYDGYANVEDIECRRISAPEEAGACWREGAAALLVDPDGSSINKIKPAAVIDAIIAKRNLGTTRCMADITIALGPGFYAGKDVHAVIETKRGHDLGRLILEGCAIPNTGIPGEIAGESARRVIRSPHDGKIIHKKQIGDIVEQNETLFLVNNSEVRAPVNGLLRGLIREGSIVGKEMKVADIDSRTDVDWHTVSDKARCIGGAALEAYYYLWNMNQRQGRSCCE